MSAERERLLRDIKFINDILYAGRPLMIPYSYVIAKFFPDSIEITEKKVGTAATDAVKLYINPEFWSKLGREEKKFVLAHEASHVMTADTEFIKTVEFSDLYNIAADCVINRTLRHIYNVSYDFLKNIVTPESTHELAEKLAKMAGIPSEKVPGVSWFESATQWEIYSYLASLLKKARKKRREGRGEGESPDDAVKRVVKRALSGDVGESPFTPEEGKARREKYRQLDREIRRIFKAGAGVGAPSPVERMLDATARGIDWRKYLDYVISTTARMYVSTWKRPSRRHPSYPGYQKFGFPSVVVLIDVSGSIPDDDLARFIEEVYDMSVKYGIREIRMIYWTSEVVRDVLVRTPAEVKREKQIASKLPSGGTVFESALKRAIKYAGPDKVVITFSDGEIFDTGISGLATSVASRFRKAVFVTTANKPKEEVPEPPWTYVEYIVGVKE